jgi:hypothetical protein
MFRNRHGEIPAVPTTDGSTANSVGAFRPEPKEVIERRDQKQAAFGELLPGETWAHRVSDRDTAVKVALADAHQNGTAFDLDAVFIKGFDAGERFGYTFGFHNGGATVSNQLLAPKRGENYLKGTRRGNEVGRPRTALEEVTQDQLTAELAGLVAAYSILPTAQKVRAIMDVLRSLPGVEVDKLAIEQDA